MHKLNVYNTSQYKNQKPTTNIDLEVIKMVFTFCSWLDSLGVVLEFWISILKILQITSKLLTQGNRHHMIRKKKTFGKFFRSYTESLSKFVISHTVFYGNLVYNLRRVKGAANFVSSGSKIVKRLWRRKYDPAIIERNIGHVLGPSTASYRSFLKHCTLTKRAVGTIWRELSKLHQRRQVPLIIIIPSDC